MKPNDRSGTMARRDRVSRYFPRHLLLYPFLLVLLAACGDSPQEPSQKTLDLAQPWAVAAPADVGMDSGDLTVATERAKAISRCMSLLVARHGKLVLEEYFHGNRADSLNDVRSVTKSVVSTLVGVALAEGFIGNLDETLGDYLPPRVAVLDSARQSISIRHLLTMTSGFQWDESGGFGSYIKWLYSDDHIRYLLDQPLVDKPGTRFNYNSAAVHLLGVLLQEAARMPLPEFADTYLFRKIGIARSHWDPLTRGYVNGGAGIDLRPRDLARLGQFFLQNGSSGGRQILPNDWVKQATTPRFDWRSAYGPLRKYTYGYLWWLEEGQAEPAYLAWGFGGQFIYVVPALDLVVVSTTRWQGLTDAGPVTKNVLDVIVNLVVPAAR